MKKSLFFLAISLIILSCEAEKESPVAQQTWFKGNTHTHTTLCGHADTHPDSVARWYLNRGYHFLILSEHDQFIDPSSVNLPAGRREDFILIPGEELSDLNHVHSTAMNIDRAIHIHPDEAIKTQAKNDPVLRKNASILQRHVDSTRAAGGHPILNHPNFQAGLAAKDIQQVKHLHLFELYNGHPQVYNWGNEKHASTEEKWDSILSAGIQMYGVSSDDAHQFQTWGPEVSNPGRGWVMVESAELSPDAITDAMAQGRFYASSGVLLKGIQRSTAVYEIEVDTAATRSATNSEFIMGFKNEAAKAGFTIEFITDGGKVIQSVEGISAKMAVPSGVKYLRGKVTFTTLKDAVPTQFFAWTQPVFLGG
ncbi:MAG: CehA/McbA family metallohydrolase [Saprospiraceae bacterium]